MSNVLKTIGFCWFFMTLRVSGVTWMVVLDGLGYDFAAWEADGIIRVASGWYLEVPGRHGILPGGSQILGICPVEGNPGGLGG